MKPKRDSWRTRNASSGLSRRGFLTHCAACTVGFFCARCSTATRESPTIPNQHGTDTSCTATASNIEGPFFVADIPIRHSLDLYGDEGQPLLLQGLVRDASCSPIIGATVIIWHADPKGNYDLTTNERRYYGQTATNKDGTYQFKTLTPGRYLNGAQFRPAHIHVKVLRGGTEVLTTQIYFRGDPFLASDPFVVDSLVLDQAPQGNINFDINIS